MFSIALKTASEAACALEVWIGASLVHHTGREHYDTSQDKPVMLEPGSNTYHRALTVPLEVPSGDYSLVVAVWLGKPGTRSLCPARPVSVAASRQGSRRVSE